MTYKIVKNPKAWWPVHVPGVADDGKPVTNSFEVRFKLLDEDENLTFLRDIENVLRTGNLDDMTLSAFATPNVMKIVEDWRGIEIEDGEGGSTSLPFNQDNVTMMVKLPNVNRAIMDAYMACRNGQPEARRGN